MLIICCLDTQISHKDFSAAKITAKLKVTQFFWILLFVELCEKKLNKYLKPIKIWTKTNYLLTLTVLTKLHYIRSSFSHLNVNFWIELVNKWTSCRENISLLRDDEVFCQFRTFEKFEFSGETCSHNS